LTYFLFLLDETLLMPVAASLHVLSVSPEGPALAASNAMTSTPTAASKTVLASPLSRMNLTEEESLGEMVEDDKENTPEHIDIDYGREDSPAHCTTYIHEVYEYLRMREVSLFRASFDQPKKNLNFFLVITSSFFLFYTH